MILYYAPGACSLSPHIVAREAGLDFETDRHSFHTGQTESGKTLRDINPKNKVPTLQLDDGSVLTEGPAIIQYLADQRPDSGLLPPPGSIERYRVVEWVSYINYEVHGEFTPLFRPGMDDARKQAAQQIVQARLAFIETQLAGKSYIANERFSIADAYLFTILKWTEFVRIDLSPYPNLTAYAARIAQRPRIREVLHAEGLLDQPQ